MKGTTKNEKARKIKETEKALSILNLIKIHSSSSGDEELIVKTRTGNPNTATNLEHRMVTIFANAGLKDLSGGLHIFRRTFATSTPSGQKLES